MANHKNKISDIACLYSRVQWEKIKPLPNENLDKYILFVPSQPDGIRLNVRILRGELPAQNGFFLTVNSSYKEDVILHYLGFELMSIAGNLALLYDRENKNYRSRLTKKSLAELIVEVPDLEHQFPFADSFYFVDYLSTKKEDRYNQLRVSVFTEVMDALSLEQVMASFFNDLDIHVYEPWKELLDKFDRKDTQYINKLFAELISEDNEVMNGVRKLRIAIKNITELYKKV